MLAAFAMGAPCAWAADHGAPKAEKDHKETKKEEGGHGKEKEGGGHGEDKKGPPKDVMGGRFAGDPVYVRLAPLILPVITPKGAEQIVTMQITIEVPDFDAADTIHSNMPKVMDALMRALYGSLGSGESREGPLVDVPKVKTKCIRALSDALGGKNIKDVLIEGVAQRHL
ncbi:MAG: hypothetical protein AB7H77_03300 [Bdellovibrionales bacterium]